MDTSYPADVTDYMRQAIASGVYPDEQALVVDAVRSLREIREREEALRQEIEIGLAEADAGNVEPWDLDALKRKVHDRCFRNPD